MVVEFKSKRNQANLFVDNTTNRYLVNIPKDISEQIFKKPRKRISLRLDAIDSNRLKATEHLTRIQELINSENWESLINYESQYLDTKILNFVRPKSFVELWDEYVNAKKANWSQAYLKNDIEQATRIFKLEEFVNIQPNEVTSIIDYLMENKSIKQAKRYLKQLAACLEWCRKRGYKIENK